MTPSGPIARVWVPDVWEVVDVPIAPAFTVGELKAAALAQAIGGPPRVNPAEYIVKYRGALVDDQQTMGGLNVPDRAPLVVLPARRRPVV